MRDRLLAILPSDGRWSNFQVFEDLVTVGQLSIQLVGLAIDHESGVTVTGSAGDIALDVPRDQTDLRAVGELIERMSIIEFRKTDLFESILEKSAS